MTNQPDNSLPVRAVIDLGTNTFHLLIVQVTTDGTIRELYRERIFVKLAEEGITTIGKAPFARGVSAMIHFRKIVEEYKCSNITAIGTAALRTASNGFDFVQAVAVATGIEIELITGTEEATLITRGVLAAIPPQEDRVLIMDIGGGSTEYILVDQGQVLFQASFPIGVSVLRNQFHHTEPIARQERHQLWQHLKEVTEPLAAALRQYPTHHLAGAAGTFDVLADMLRDDTSPEHPTSQRLTLAEFPALAAKIIGATAAERRQIPGLPQERVDMITVAILLLQFTLELADIQTVTVSEWAMKEGVLLGS